MHIEYYVQSSFILLHLYVFVYCTLLNFIVRAWAKDSFLHSLCKNSLSTACPACIPLLVDIRHFPRSLLTVPGLHHHDCSSTDALFKFKILILLLLHFDNRRSLERDRRDGPGRIPNSTEYVRESLVFVQHIWQPESQFRRPDLQRLQRQ